jgi:hypothetical protein
VAVQDSLGNVVTGDGSTSVGLAFGTNPSSATLTGGGAVTVSSGVATFSGLSVNKSGVGYTLTATSGSLTSATSSTFTITVGAAAKLAFTTQPSASVVSGLALTQQPVVTVQDAGGNTVTGSTAAITLTSSGGTLACATNPRSAVSGVATFSGCVITTPGTYTLTASSGSLTSATSVSIVVSAGPTVGVATSITASAGTQTGDTKVKFSAPASVTGIASYTCDVYVNTGATSSPVLGALILGGTVCTAGGGGTNIVLGSIYTGANKIVVIVNSIPSAGYTGASSAPVVGSVK